MTPSYRKRMLPKGCPQHSLWMRKFSPHRSTVLPTTVGISIKDPESLMLVYVIRLYGCVSLRSLWAIYLSLLYSEQSSTSPE